MDRREFIRLAGAGAAAGIIVSELPATAGIRKYSDLQYHKVTDIKFTTLRLDYPRLVGKNSTLGIHGKWTEEAIHILYSDQGASGWGLNKGSQQAIAEKFELIKDKSVSDLIVPSSGVMMPEIKCFDYAYCYAIIPCLVHLCIKIYEV